MKVAEYQARGAIHFHAIIRLDAAPPREDPEQIAPPPAGFCAELLTEALRPAAATVAVPYPSVEEGPVRLARWGEQLDVRNVTRGDDEAGELSAEQVAGYIAKYATKATESFGSGLDHRLTEGDLGQLDLPAHVAGLVRAAWELGAHPPLARLRLRAWAHMLGFRGHWSTKSRRYSTTMTALRRARVAYAKRRRARDGVPLDAWGRAEDDDQAAVVIATWSYVGAGYQTQGEVWLALSAAARARERRRIAREELTTHDHDRCCCMTLRTLEGPKVDTLLTLEQAAERLGTSVRFVRRLVAERRIAYVKLGRYVRIAEPDLINFVATGRVEAGGLRGA
jgi:excisionase family DNA binding protein